MYKNLSNSIKMIMEQDALASRSLMQLHQTIMQRGYATSNEYGQALQLSMHAVNSPDFSVEDVMRQIHDAASKAAGSDVTDDNAATIINPYKNMTNTVVDVLQNRNRKIQHKMKIID